MNNKYKELKDKIKGLSVLLVEDEPDIANEEKKFLKRFFSYVDMANNGAEGVEMFERHPYNVIFADIKMPVMNGWEMVKRVKNMAPETFVIVLTASRGSAKEHTGWYDMYFEKPIGFEDMVHIMNEIGKRGHD